MQSTEKYSLLYTCRTCTKSFDENDQDGFDLFTVLKISIKDMSASYKIFEVLGLLELKITPYDELPQRICNECKNFLINLCSFRFICETSQEKLRHYFHEHLLGNSISDIKYDTEIIFFEEISENAVTPTVAAVNQDQSSITPKEFEFFDVGDVYDNKTIIQQNLEIDHNYGSKTKQPEQYFINTVNVYESENEDQKYEQIDSTIHNEGEQFANNSCIVIDNATSPKNNDVDAYREKLDNEFKCKKCNRHFVEKALLEKHEKFGACSVIVEKKRKEAKVSDQPKDRQYECLICSKIFKSKHLLKSHTHRMHQEKDEIFECDFCHKTYGIKRYLIKHMERIHIMSEYTCPHCSQKFTRKHIFRYHLKSHEPNKKYKCNYCDKSYLQEHHLKTHESVHTGIKNYLCAECGGMFHDPRMLKTHQHKYTKPREKVAKVEKLEKVHSTTCNICGTVLLNVEECKAHMEHHFPSMEKNKGSFKRGGAAKEFYTPFYRFRCTLCPRAFKLPSSLQSHMEKSHNGDRNFECSDCGYTFKRMEHLRCHINNVHLKLKPHSCQYCGKRFANNVQLKGHVIFHTGEKQFKCDECEKSFYTHSDLRRHTYLHTGERPFICDVCSKGFHSYAGLADHYKKHFT